MFDTSKFDELLKLEGAKYQYKHLQWVSFITPESILKNKLQQ